MMTSPTIKLQRYLAERGVASRRVAENLIAAGKIVVNGKIATIGQRVNPDKDEVLLDGKPVKERQENIYIILNKPKGVVTTAKDEAGRKTVLDLVSRHVNLEKYRIFPVGRLDKNSLGLVFLTNDGDIAYKILHPKNKIPKVYIVEITGQISNSSIQKLEEGVIIEGKRTLPAEIQKLASKKRTTVLRVTIYEGRKRQIRKMMKLIGNPVVRLERIKIGPLSVGDLKRGSFRFLEDKEVEELKNYLEQN